MCRNMPFSGFVQAFMLEIEALTRYIATIYTIDSYVTKCGRGQDNRTLDESYPESMYLVFRMCALCAKLVITMSIQTRQYGDMSYISYICTSLHTCYGKEKRSRRG